jgi:hypothetical protein
MWGSGGITQCLLTSALHEIKSWASRPGRFIPGEIVKVPIGQEAEWVPESVWKKWRREAQ